VPWANEKSTSSWKRPWTTGRSSLLPTQPASGYRSAFTRDPFWALPLPGTSAPRRDLDRPRRDPPSTPPHPPPLTPAPEPGTKRPSRAARRRLRPVIKG
jgi:hypothetical protein